MTQIIAWKSETDGKIFEDKKKYQNHLRKLARHRLVQRKLQIKEEISTKRWKELYEQEIDIADWPELVLKNQEMFWAEAAKNSYDWQGVGKKSRKGILMPVPKLLEFSEFRLTWNDSVSNSHSCPVDGVQNWGGRIKMPDGTDAPRGYPGWQGRVEWIVAWPKEWDGVYLGGDLFRSGTFCTGRQRAHSGTGGGGGMRYSEKHKCHVMSFGYDFRIYAADWPGMTRRREKIKMWEVLTN